MFKNWLAKAKETLFGATEPVPLGDLIAQFNNSIPFWSPVSERSALACAKFADRYRYLQIQPVAPAAFAASWDRLDEAGQLRLCLMISAIELDAVARHFQMMTSISWQAETPLNTLSDLAGQLTLLPVALLQQSEIRMEEFSRHFCKALAIPVAGETVESSEKRLYDIDFARLSNEADIAMELAEENLERLREQQRELQNKTRGRRGKF